jgi:hypothetical protein
MRSVIPYTLHYFTERMLEKQSRIKKSLWLGSPYDIAPSRVCIYNLPYKVLAVWRGKHFLNR